MSPLSYDFLVRILVHLFLYFTNSMGLQVTVHSVVSTSQITPAGPFVLIFIAMFVSQLSHRKLNQSLWTRFLKILRTLCADSDRELQKSSTEIFNNNAYSYELSAFFAKIISLFSRTTKGFPSKCLQMLSLSHSSGWKISSL